MAVFLALSYTQDTETTDITLGPFTTRKHAEHFFETVNNPEQFARSGYFTHEIKSANIGEIEALNPELFYLLLRIWFIPWDKINVMFL